MPSEDPPEESDSSAPENDASPVTSMEARDRDDPDDEDPTGVVEGPAGREVVVPMRLYKTVTVVGTLLAMVAIVAGFVLLDAATNRAQAAIENVDPVLALLGLGAIVAGAVIYALSTRFRAEGMGESDRSSE